MNAMLISFGASNNFWEEATLVACHLQNRIIFKKTERTLMICGKIIDLTWNTLKCGGCLAKVLLLEPKKRKIRSKIADCLFIGYAEYSAAYRFLVL